MHRSFRIALLIFSILLSAKGAHAQTSISFQNGVNGYTGTQDLDIRQANPNFNYQNYQFNDVAFTDAADAGQANAIQTMLRFDNIIGANAIPVGATIVSATLQLTTAPVARSGDGHGGTFHLMLHDWSANTATWNSMVNGVSADDVEAQSAASFQAGQVPSILQPGAISFDVANDVRAWANGQANYGWATLPLIDGTNGWGILTSDQAIVGSRPKLSVSYITVPEPGSIALLVGAGLSGAGLLLRRRRK